MRQCCWFLILTACSGSSFEASPGAPDGGTLALDDERHDAEVTLGSGGTPGAAGMVGAAGAPHAGSPAAGAPPDGGTAGVPTALAGAGAGSEAGGGGSGGEDATGGMPTGGWGGTPEAGGGGSGGTAGSPDGGSAGAPQTGFASCTQSFDDQCGTDEHWECDGDYNLGPYRPGYRCNTWASMRSGTWCCTPWPSGESVIHACAIPSDCPACAGLTTGTVPMCCTYNPSTAAPLPEPTCGCGSGLSTCIPNVEAQ